MASKDLHGSVKEAVALNITAISASGATVGAIIDTLGYESVEFVIHSGTITDGTYTPKIEDGAAANLSDAANSTALLGTIAGATFLATDDNAVKRIGYRGHKRYVRLTITAATVTTGGTISAVAILGHPRLGPVP